MTAQHIFLSTHNIQLAQFRFRVQGDIDWTDVPDVFGMRYEVVPGGLQYFASATYLPGKAQELIAQGHVVGMELYTLMPNSPAALAMASPRQPNTLVLTLQLKEGTLLDCTPPVIRTLRRRLWAEGLAWASAGAVLAAFGWLFTGGLLAGLATHRFRSALELPKSGWKADLHL